MQIRSQCCCPERIRTRKRPSSPSALSALYQRPMSLRKNTQNGPRSSRLRGAPQSVTGQSGQDFGNWAKSQPSKPRNPTPRTGSPALWIHSRIPQLNRCAIAAWSLPRQRRKWLLPSGSEANLSDNLTSGPL